jgi:hypothetical protein
MTLWLHHEVRREINVAPQCFDTFHNISRKNLECLVSYNDFATLKGRSSREFFIDKFVEFVGVII